MSATRSARCAVEDGVAALVVPDPPLADPAAGVVLRPWSATAADVSTLVAAWSDPVVAATCGVPADRSPAAAARWLRDEPARRARGRALDLAITAAGRTDACGEVGLRNVDRVRGRAEISWWMVAEHRGRGLATASARLLVDWALSDAVGLAQVWCRIPPGNAASSAVARAAGLVELGTADDVAVWARAVARPSPASPDARR